MSVGLVLLGALAFQVPDSTALRAAGWLMLAGIVLFSGSLYAIGLGAPRALGVVTPGGAAAFIIAWVLAAIAAVRG